MVSSTRTPLNVAPHRRFRQAAPSSLVLRSLLQAPGGRECLTLYRTAGEAVITHVPGAAGRGAISTRGPAASGGASGHPRNGRRARGKVRRYCRHNRLRYLWTLTYALEPKSHAQVVADLRVFFERIRQAYRSRPLIAVIERGTENGRLHVHFALDRWTWKHGVHVLWGFGWVDVSGPKSGGARWPTGELARYLAKYVSKDVDEQSDGDAAERAAGEHRYLVTQGHQPTAWTWRAHHPEYLWALAILLEGEPEVAIPFGEEPGSIVWGWWLSWPDP